MPFLFNQNNFAQNRSQNRKQNQSQPQNPIFASPFSNALFQGNQQQWQQAGQQQQMPQQRQQRQMPQQRQQTQQQRGQNNGNASKNQENNAGYKNLGGFTPNNLPDGISLMPINPNATGDLRQLIMDRGAALPTAANSPPPISTPDSNENNLQLPPIQSNAAQKGLTPPNIPALQPDPRITDLLKRFIQNERNCEVFYNMFAEDVSNTDIKMKLAGYGRQSKDHMNAYSSILGKRNESFQPEDKNVVKCADLQEGLEIAVREELEALGEFGELYSMIMDYTEKNILSKILIEKFIRINVMMSYRR